MKTLIKLAKDFDNFAKKLERDGVRGFSIHKRIAIPKKDLPEKRLKGIGFKKSYTGVPEPGQKRFVSFRKHDDGHHIHDHGDHWVMHKDRHPPKVKNIKDSINHIKDEAIPSVKKYLAWDKGPILNHIIDEGKEGLEKSKKAIGIK